MMKSLLVAAAASMALFAGIPAASAQTSVTTTTVSPSSTGSITIAPEKKTIIRKELSTAEPVTVKEKVTVGWTVPTTVALEPVPQTVVADVPSVKGYEFFRYNDQVVLVDPKTRKVVTIIE